MRGPHRLSIERGPSDAGVAHWGGRSNHPAVEHGSTPNRLANETSPCLLQHAHNPVDWYPWGEEAFARARAENRPILLSVGYSSCHWCHVMERESFEDESTARLMNDLFVNVKVDREERSDVDDVYMRAVQMHTGRGGWHKTAFLTRPSSSSFSATTGRPAAATPSTRCASPASAWRAAVSTTRSAGASTATRSTPSGSCRTSRRCSTTTPSSHACTWRRSRQPAN